MYLGQSYRKKMLFIPVWFNHKTDAEYVDYSVIFQKALEEYLHIYEKRLSLDGACCIDMLHSA